MKSRFSKVKSGLAKRGWLVGIVLGLAIGLILSALYLINISSLARWQQSLTDSMFVGHTPNSQVVMVAVDEKSLSKLGRWPWPRTNHARLIKAVNEAGAKLIVFDVDFSEESSPTDDKALADSMVKAGNVILPMMFDLKSSQTDSGLSVATAIESPAKIFAKSFRSSGHVNITPDSDGVVRTLPLLIDMKNVQYPALALAALSQTDQAYETLPQVGANTNVKLRSREIPVETGGRMRINYAGPAGTFKTVSYIDVLNNAVNKSVFKDKTVFVGVTAKALGDLYMTPVSEGTPMSGLEIHANVIDTIARGHFIVNQSVPSTVLIIIFLAVVSSLIFSRLNALWSGLIGIALIIAVVVFTIVRFEQGVIVNMVYPSFSVLGAYMAVITSRYVIEGRERRKVQSLFGRYVKPEIVAEIIASADEDIVKLKGYSQTVTTMFADIRGFTSMSEKLQPEEVVAMLNHYLDFITEIIFKHDGTLDKYIGDATMAFFNAPHLQTDHALKAVKAALEVQARVCEMEADMPPGIACATYGIGVNTGEAVVGNIGSSKRHDYTIIGDSVNVASRLCSAAKPGQVLISPSTYELVKEDIDAEEMPAMSFKGKDKPMVVYNVKNLKPDSK